MNRPQAALADFQQAFAAYLRDPLQQQPPAGIPERPARLYGDLLFNNIASALDGCLPICRSQLDETRWEQLQRAFFRDWPSHTPLLWQIPGEFANYLAENADQLDLPPWLPELAHYEWMELAVDTCDAPMPPCAADGDLIEGCPVLNSTLQRLYYAWPVQRIGQGEAPASPDASLLLMWRDADQQVRIEQINAAGARLLELIDADQVADQVSGRQACLQLADEMQLEDPQSLLGFARELLERWRDLGAIIGTAPPQA